MLNHHSGSSGFVSLAPHGAAGGGGGVRAEPARARAELRHLLRQVAGVGNPDARPIRSSSQGDGTHVGGDGGGGDAGPSTSGDGSGDAPSGVGVTGGWNSGAGEHHVLPLTRCALSTASLKTSIARALSKAAIWMRTSTHAFEHALVSGVGTSAIVSSSDVGSRRRHRIDDERQSFSNTFDVSDPL